MEADDLKVDKGSLGFDFSPDEVAQIKKVNLDLKEIREKVIEACEDDATRAKSIIRLAVFSVSEKPSIKSVVSIAEANKNLGITKMTTNDEDDGKTITLYRVQRAFAPEISAYISANNLPMWKSNLIDPKYQFVGAIELITTLELARSYLLWVEESVNKGLTSSFLPSSKRILKGKGFAVA